MNIRLTYPDRIDTWDTRAGAGDATVHARLSVADAPDGGTHLEVWSQLAVEHHSEDGELKDVTREAGYHSAIAHIEGRAGSIQGALDLLGEEQGLLRCDVDGEAIWEAEPPIDDPGNELTIVV